MDIKGEHMERAEAILSRTYKIGRGSDPGGFLLERAKVNQTDFEAFLKHHSVALFKEYIPEVDPRHEASINTMLRHFFLVGVLSQQIARGNEAAL